jgi:hypothetical protein
VKILIQKIATGLFLNSDGKWGDSRDEARVFDRVPAAIEFCLTKGLANVRLILAFGDPRLDLVIQVFGDGSEELRKPLRKGVQESRELKVRNRELRTALDGKMAEQKEKKKQIPFNRKSVGKNEDEE